MRDQSDSIHVLPLFPPAAGKTDNSNWVSAIIPVNGYESMTLALITGSMLSSGATFSVLVEDGNDPALADHAPVDPTLLIGTSAQAGFAASNPNVSRKIGYIGYKAYVRVIVTPSGNSSVAYMAGVAILGRPHNSPTPNPPM